MREVLLRSLSLLLLYKTTTLEQNQRALTQSHAFARKLIERLVLVVCLYGPLPQLQNQIITYSSVPAAIAELARSARSCSKFVISELRGAAGMVLTSMQQPKQKQMQQADIDE